MPNSAAMCEAATTTPFTGASAPERVNVLSNVEKCHCARTGVPARADGRLALCGRHESPRRGAEYSPNFKPFAVFLRVSEIERFDRQRGIRRRGGLRVLSN